MSATLVQPVIRGVRVFLAHAPGLVRHGSKPSRDLARDEGLMRAIRAHLRPYEAAVAYPPNRVFLGALAPEALAALPRPWFAHAQGGAERRAPHGEIMPEAEFLALLKIADDAGLVALEKGFAAEARQALAAHPLIAAEELARLDSGAEEGEIAALLAAGKPAKGLPALALERADGRVIG